MHSKAKTYLKIPHKLNLRSSFVAYKYHRNNSNHNNNFALCCSLFYDEETIYMIKCKYSYSLNKKQVYTLRISSSRSH